MADEAPDKKNKANFALINSFTEIGWPDPFPIVEKVAGKGKN